MSELAQQLLFFGRAKSRESQQRAKVTAMPSTVGPDFYDFTDGEKEGGDSGGLYDFSTKSRARLLRRHRFYPFPGGIKNFFRFGKAALYH